MFSGGRRWWFVGVAAVVVVAGLVTWLVWPAPAPPPRARPYLDYTACLLTGEKGLGDPAVRPVWSGMQDASLATHAKVEYVAVAGPDTVEAAAPYLAGLLQRRCAVVLAVGPAQAAAVRDAAAANPSVHFVVVGPGTSGGNLTVIAATDDQRTHDQVQSTVTGFVPAG